MNESLLKAAFGAGFQAGAEAAFAELAKWQKEGAPDLHDGRDPVGEGCEFFAGAKGMAWREHNEKAG